MKKFGFIILLGTALFSVKAQRPTSNFLALVQEGIETTVNYTVLAANFVAYDVVGECVQKDTLNQDSATQDSDKECDSKGDFEKFKTLAAKTAKVFVEADDKGVLAHAQKAISYWSFWNLVENQTEADFILEIKFRYGNMGKSFAYAIVRNLQGNEVYRTAEATNIGVADFNSKRASVTRVINEFIKPKFE